MSHRVEQLTPRFLEKTSWGRTRLEPWFASTGAKIGEVWFEGPSPILVKFLFTSDRLSVQVHPDDAYAALHHKSRGKTEMWHVLEAEPGARIAAGFREAISQQRLRAAAESGEIVDLLEWHRAAPGDTFFIPAGTVHAIGGGLVLCEIQQHSDITYRLYDYGRPRELHLEHALAVSRRELHAARQFSDVVSCPYFTTRRMDVRTSARIEGELLIVIGGEGEIAGQPARPGQVWHASAASEVSGDLTLLLVSGAGLSPQRGL